MLIKFVLIVVDMIKDYLSLIRADKPIGTLLLLWPTLWALFIAAHGMPPFYTLLVFSAGVFLTRSAGCAINDVFDADFDRHVERTANRPITSGRISRTQGVLTCIVLSATAFILAYIFLAPQTLIYCVPALVIFVTYPLMKRILPLPQAYLGVAFSFGILMAFVEVGSGTGFLAWLCFLANLFWVLGYDTIYALEDIKDDAKIGIKTSALTLGRHVVNFVAACYALFILLQLELGLLLRLGWFYYLALFVAALLLWQQIKVIRCTEKYLLMFRLNNLVGVCIFAGIVIGLQH